MILICNLFLCSHGIAQGLLKYRCWIASTDQPANFNTFSDSSSLLEFVQSQQEKDISKGYFLAGIDSIQKDSFYNYFYNRNRKFYGIYLSIQDSSILENHLFDTSSSILNPLQCISLRNAIIQKYSSKGFPFVQLSFKPIKIINDTLYAQLNIKKGPKIKFGPIDQRNAIIVDQRFLHQLTGIKIGEPFDEFKYQRVDNILSQLNYLEIQYPSRIFFLGEEAIIHLYLQKRNANSFDFLIGFNNKPNTQQRTVQITGQASIDLNNSFRLGERLYFHYENLQESSPTLRIISDFPYLRYVPFGVLFQFDLNKFGEEFVNLQSGFNIRKSFSPREELNLVLHYNSSYLLNIDSSLIKNTLQLPSNLDFSFFSYGVSYKHNTLNYKFNPSSGFLLEYQTNIGQKSFIKNSSLLQYDQENKLLNQYDSLNKSNFQMNNKLLFNYYYKLAGRFVLKGGLNAFKIFTNAKILQNELVRIGGIYNLRGFNDNFFAASGYLISSLECRYLLDRDSYLNTFIDYGYLQSITKTETLPWQSNIGIGAGMQLKTKAGTFGLFVAVNKLYNSDFDFSNPKVHFGYTALF